MTEQGPERYPARFARRLTELYPELSFTRAKRVIEGGQVSVDGRQLFDPGAYVAPEATLVWDPHRQIERQVEGTLNFLETRHIADEEAGLYTLFAGFAARQ